MRKIARLLSAIAVIAMLASCSSKPASPIHHTPLFITETLSFQTPTPGWSLAPVAAYRLGSEHWCIHQLTGPEGMAAQMISEVSGAISFAEDLSGKTTVKHFVIGKTWKWNSNPEITFIDSMDELDETLKNATKLVLLQIP